MSLFCNFVIWLRELIQKNKQETLGVLNFLLEKQGEGVLTFKVNKSREEISCYLKKIQDLPTDDCFQKYDHIKENKKSMLILLEYTDTITTEGIWYYVFHCEYNSTKNIHPNEFLNRFKMNIIERKYIH